MSKSAAAAWRLPWAQIQRFAGQVAMGVSATQAYQTIRPDVTNSTARVNGPNLVHQPRVQLAIQAARKALVERATEEFILTRDEVLRVHTMAALTPVAEVDEKHFLAQEVTYKYATDEEGMPILGADGKPLITEKKIKMVSKSDALKEISKLQGFYQPEKIEIQDTTKRDDALQRLADDPLFAELMAQQVPIVERAIEMREITEPGPPRRTLEEIEEAQRLDDEFLETL